MQGWGPVAFASRKQQGAEVQYTVPDKEYAAIVFGLGKFREILYGEEFSVVIEHATPVWLMKLSDPKDRLARWVVEVQVFQFKVEYEQGDGKHLAVPDTLSRYTMLPEMRVTRLGQRKNGHTLHHM